MQYEKINSDQQVQMLDQRLAQYEAEHFAHATNLSLLEAAEAPTDEQSLAAWEQAKETAREAMKTLDDAHANTKREIEKLQDPVAAKRKK